MRNQCQAHAPPSKRTCYDEAQSKQHLLCQQRLDVPSLSSTTTLRCGSRPAPDIGPTGGPHTGRHYPSLPLLQSAAQRWPQGRHSRWQCLYASIATETANQQRLADTRLPSKTTVSFTRNSWCCMCIMFGWFYVLALINIKPVVQFDVKGAGHRLESK